MRTPFMILAAALALSATSFGVRADDTTVEPDLAAIRAQQTELREQAQAGDGAFAEMSQRKREDLLSQQDLLLELIDGKQTLSELSDNDQLRAYNALEWINGLITNAEEQRMVCLSEVKTGSHRKTRVCKTAAQRRQEREDTLRVLRGEFQSGFAPVGN